MATLSLILLSLLPFISIIQAQTPAAPAPAPAGPPNITAILEKKGNFKTFIRFLHDTAAGDQINNQANNSRDGMTVFAPTDNAFQNLPAGALNDLTDQQHVQLIQFHILPKFYNFQNLQTVSNPVRTQASGQDGKPFGLNFTGSANNQNQVNVTSGIVNTTVYNALSQAFPLAVYEVDKVLLPVEFYQASAPAPSPPAPSTTKGGSSGGGGKTVPSSEGPSPSGSGRVIVGLMSMASGFLIFCIAMLS
nr:fasciclin-like arabinogalactan protein 6 [Centaurium erythraea]